MPDLNAAHILALFIVCVTIVNCVRLFKGKENG